MNCTNYSKGEGMKSTFYTGIIIPILLFILFGSNTTYAIYFLNDTVNVEPEKSTSITIANDSSHEMSVDSIKIILLEGSILGEIDFTFSDVFRDSSGLPYITNSYSNILVQNDTTFTLEQYLKDIQRDNYNKIKMAANSQRTINWLQIGSGLGNSIASYALKKRTTLKVGDEYVIKLIFYSNDNTKGFVVIRGKNVIVDSTPVRHTINNKFITSNRMALNRYTDLLGRSGGQNMLNSPSVNLHIIITNNNRVISKFNL